ncbi:MAG: PAS domain-containing protein [Anaerolineae bacterium]|nr:PAS domain-containing protein [Anaerolineae bacterium]
MTRLSGHRTAWVLIALAITLMAARRIITFLDMLTSSTTQSRDLPAELIALVISILMVGGVLRIGPLLRAVEQSQAILKQAHTELQQQVQVRTSELRAANVHFSREIAERLGAEHAEREQRVFLRQIIDAIPNLIYVKDNEGRYTLVNERFAEVFGGSVEHITGQTDTDLLPEPERAARYRRQDQIVISSRQPLFFPVGRMQNLTTGQWDWYQTAKVPLASPDGVVRHVLGVVSNITELKQIELQLEESRAALDAVLKAIPDLIFRINRDGTYREAYVSDASLLYVPEETFIGKTIHEVFPPEIANGTLALLKQALDTQETQRIDYPLDVPAGQRYFEARFVPTSAEDILLIVRDITQQKQLQQAQLEQEISRILSDFITDAAQEFGTPLSVIKTALYLVERSPDPDRRANSLRMLNKQTGHLEKLVDGMLTMTRLDQNMAFHCAPVDLNTVTQLAVDSVSGDVDEAGLTLDVQLAPDLPPISGDEAHLHRAIRNLLDNAILFNRDGGLIRLCTGRTDTHLMVKVCDTGIGIAPEHLNVVFQRFFRVDAAREKRGAGLGLSIALKIVERHGGTIIAESTPGEGSTFRVFLPIPTD